MQSAPSRTVSAAALLPRGCSAAARWAQSARGFAAFRQAKRHRAAGARHGLHGKFAPCQLPVPQTTRATPIRACFGPSTRQEPVNGPKKGSADPGPRHSARRRRRRPWAPRSGAFACSGPDFLLLLVREPLAPRAVQLERQAAFRARVWERRCCFSQFRGRYLAARRFERRTLDSRAPDRPGGGAREAGP